MKTVIVGNNYEFSDDLKSWEFGKLNQLGADCNALYQCKSQIDGNTKTEWFTHIRELTENVKPVYTQAMKDNDILPVAGMNCLVMDTTLMNAEYEKCTILFIGIWKVVYTSESCIERISDKEDVNFKPLTPPIVLEDGKAYSFDYNNKEYTGLFNMYLGSFIIPGGFIAASYPKNIKQLT
jgi:hypothetical protein